MKKLVEFVMPIKIFGAMIFFGLVGLYMAGGVLHIIITGERIAYTVPFVYLLQSAGLSIVFATLWALFFDENIIKKWRFFPRYILFALSIITLLAVSFFTFLAVPVQWASSLLFVFLAVFSVTTIFLSLNELYFKKTGERYVEMLNTYKKSLPQ